jgi:hypothetical protein
MASNRILVDLDGGLINNLINWRHNPLTSAARISLGASLTAANIGLFVFDINLLQGFYWSGSAWVPSGGGGGGAVWGSITGILSNQTDLQNDLNLKANISSLAPVAFSGHYSDLTGQPTLLSQFTNDPGYITSASLPTFNNGLTETSNVVQLGGSLIQDTFINLSTFGLALQSAAGTQFAISDAGITEQTAYDIYGNNSSLEVISSGIFGTVQGPSGTTLIYIKPEGILITSNYFALQAQLEIQDGTQGNVGDVFTSINNQGLGAWVTPPSGATGVLSANDGLSVSGSVAKLGQAVGAIGNPAALTENRQLPMGGFSTNFDSGNFTITNPNPYFLDVTVPSGGGVYYFKRVNFNTNVTSHQFYDWYLSTDNGDGTFDHVQAQGFRGNGNTIPNWFESLEYQYLSAGYERHIQFQAYNSELRLSSYTYAFSGIDFAHDSCLFFHSLTSWAIRSMGTQHEGLFYSGGTPTAPGQFGFGNDDLAGGTLTGYIEKCDSVNHKVSLQNNGNDPSGTSYEFQGFPKIYFDTIGSHSIYVDGSDWSLHADKVWVANPSSNTFSIDNASTLDLQINFQPSRNTYHMIVSTATAEWGDYIPSPNGYSRTFYWGTTQMLSLSKSVALFSTPVQIEDGSQGTIGNVFTSIDINGTGRWEPVSIGGIAAGGDLSGTFPNPTVLNSAVIGKVLTGYVSGAGVVSPTDTILSAIEKLNGNIGALVTGVSSFNSRTGAITLLSSDVTGALGFTPQPAGNYITALTGDVTAAGPGSSVATLATVNANVGSFGDATHVAAFTVNAKGLITAASSVAITFPVTSVFGRTGAVVATTGDYTIAQITNGLSNVLASGDLFVGNGSNIATGVPASGDLTLSNTGAFTIGSNVVTYAKMQQASAHTLLGNPTGATANISEITLGSGLSFSGTTLTATGTGGTVTSFSAGTLSPLFTTSVANPTTTPALTFSLSNAGAFTIFGNDTAGSAAPTFFTPTLTDGLFANEGTTTTVLHGNAAGNLSFAAVANADLANSSITFSAPGTSGLAPNWLTSPVSLGGTATLEIPLASTASVTAGLISNTNFNTFNNKQPAGNYITALTGDGTAAGPGSVAFTLATVNANVGTFGDSTHVGQFTVNAKGLITAASAVAIAFPVTFVFGRTGAVVATTGDYTIAQITNGLSNVLAATDIFVGSAGGLAVAVPLTGDASITSAGVLTLGANVVTYAKFQQVAAASLVGNPTGSLANAEGITLGTGLSFTGTVLNVTGIPTSVSNIDGSLTISPTTGAVIASLNVAHANTWTGIQSFTAGTLVSLANTALAPAHTFTLSGAVLMTSPVAGDMEVDSTGLLYYTNLSTSRAKVDVEHFICLTAAYTLTSQTGAQKMFNATTNGALTVAASTTYFFECDFNISNMSATSGSFGFAFGGTATITSQGWKAVATKSTLTAATNPTMTYNTIANITLTSANTTTTGAALIRGIIRINAGGTLIPQISLGVANAAIMGVNSYFRIWPVGSNVVTNLGAWS